jgi:polyhydroxybutyrate depolymerase|tara:strand:- start:79 stop:1002 length:924 start_codon:yes stop_codon:yes gene_type:complete
MKKYNLMLSVFFTAILFIGCEPNKNDIVIEPQTNGQYLIFNHDGLDREYIYYEPINLEPDSPLIVVMHGYTSDASAIESYSGFNAIADSEGFAVCYPRGTNDFLDNRFFNVEYEFHIGIETVDDLGFIEALASHLQITRGLDPDRIYGTGMSNGGDMCYKIACQGSGVFKGIASIAGTMLQDIQDNCTNNISIPVMEIHGTNDGITFYDGAINNTGGWGPYLAVDTMIEFFANRNGYTSFQSENLPNINATDGSTVTSLKYTNPSNCNDVWLYRVVGGRHDWPGSFGNMDINSSAEIWNFFQTIYCN